MRRVPATLQTAYADLLDRVLTAANDGAREHGGYTSKLIKGRRYWYLQETVDGRQRQRYVGPETPELLRRIEESRRARNADRDRRALVRALSQGGLPAPSARAGQTLEALAGIGLFRDHGAVLVGNTACQVYASMLGARFDAPSMDADEFGVTTKSLSFVAEDIESEAVLRALQAVDPDFACHHDRQHDSGPDIAFASGDLRVEFLTPPPCGRRPAPPFHLAFLLDGTPHEAVVLYKAGILVKVPAPARFAMHRLFVSGHVRQTAPSRRRKDLELAASLLRILLEDRPNELRDLWHEAADRTPGWMEAARDCTAALPEDLQQAVQDCLGEAAPTRWGP